MSAGNQVEYEFTSALRKKLRRDGIGKMYVRLVRNKTNYQECSSYFHRVSGEQNRSNKSQFKQMFTRWTCTPLKPGKLPTLAVLFQCQMSYAIFW